jgi:hypothetical protein
VTAAAPPVRRLAAGSLVAALSLAAMARAENEVPAGFRRFLPRGRIASLDAPQYVAGSRASIPPEAWVLGIVVDGQARAYSLNLLNRHEVVNDLYGDRPVAVIWCPLANAGAVYSRRIQSRDLRFEPSGVLMNGSIVVQDKETDTFWPIILGAAAVGPLKGTPLETLPGSVKVQWKDWLRLHPDTIVLSEGGAEHIENNPYQTYIDSAYGFKGIAPVDLRLKAKDPVYAFELGRKKVAAPFAEFEEGKAFIVEGAPIFLYRPRGVEVYYSTRAYVSAGGFEEKNGAWVDKGTGARFDTARGDFVGGAEPQRLKGFDTFWYIWSLSWPDTILLGASR